MFIAWFLDLAVSLRAFDFLFKWSTRHSSHQRHQSCCFFSVKMSKCTSSAAVTSLPSYWACNIQTMSSQNQAYRYNKKTGTSHYVINKCEQIHRVNIREKPITTPQCPQDCGKILNDWTLSASTRDIVCNLFRDSLTKILQMIIIFLRNSKCLSNYGPHSGSISLDALIHAYRINFVSQTGCESNSRFNHINWF